jgi:hypothetical protein
MKQLLEITSVTKQLYRWAVTSGSENILEPTYLPLLRAFLCEWHYQKPSSHMGLYIARTWSRSGFKVRRFCVTCVCVCLSAGNEHRMFAIHRLSQKKTLMHADVCTSIQHSSRLFVLKAKENPLCKDTTGTVRPCSNHLTQLLNRDSTADMPTSDFCQTRPQVRSATLPRRSLLPLCGMRLNVISFTPARTVRLSPCSFHDTCTVCRCLTPSVNAPERQVCTFMHSTPLSLRRLSLNSHLPQKFVHTAAALKFIQIGKKVQQTHWRPYVECGVFW